MHLYEVAFMNNKALHIVAEDIDHALRLAKEYREAQGWTKQTDDIAQIGIKSIMLVSTNTVIQDG